MGLGPSKTPPRGGAAGRFLSPDARPEGEPQLARPHFFALASKKPPACLILIQLFT